MGLPAEFIYLDRSRASGKVTIWKTPAIPLVTSDTLADDGISTTRRRPCIVRFRGDVYVVGCYSRPVYYPYRDPRWWPVGIMPPPQTIVVSAGSGTGGATGVALCYIAYQHRAGANGDILLAESNPSNVVQMTLTGSGRKWEGLLASKAERRVTHVAGYASVNGSNYRRAFLLPYGAQTYEENLPTNKLSLQGPDANYLPPNGVAFATEFAGRMWYANTSEHPYRVWRSDPGEPQYVGLAAFLDTTDRDAIVGMRKLQNVLLIGTQTCCYSVRAYGTGSFVLEKLDSSVGLLTHFGMLEIHNKLWFPSHDGYFVFDGAGFYFVMKDIRPYWLADRAVDEAAFENGFAIDDRIGKNLLFITNRTERPDFEGYAPGTVIYVGNYLNFERTMGAGQEQPDWSLDVRTRFDHSAFYGLDNVMYFGSEDGKIRAEDETDPDDDADTLAKPGLIEAGHQLFGEPGDDPQQGKKVDQLWLYVESETTAWTCYVMMGDEWAASRLEPDNVLSHWKVDVAASALVQAILDPSEDGTALASYIPETVHNLGAVEGTSGRGLTMRVRFNSAVGFKFRGYGGAWSPSGAPRHETRITSFKLQDNGVDLATNTALVPYAGIAALLRVSLSNADLTYPLTIDWEWAGAHVEVQSQNLASGLVGVGIDFAPAAGVSTLTVSVTSGGKTMSKTYHYDI